MSVIQPRPAAHAPRRINADILNSPTIDSTLYALKGWRNLLFLSQTLTFVRPVQTNLLACLIFASAFEIFAALLQDVHSRLVMEICPKILVSQKNTSQNQELVNCCSENI